MRCVDLHCDTLTEIYNRKQLLLRNDLHISLEKSGYLRPYVQTFAIFIEDERKNKIRYLKNCYDYFVKQVEQNSGISLCKTFEDISVASSGGKTAAVLSAENISYVAETNDALDLLCQMGIKFASLTWNGENCLAGGAESEGDLTDLGRQIVKAMESRGIILDVSHLNEKSFNSVISVADKPIAATHSNCFALCNHPRNLKDYQIKTIAQRGGIIGLNLYPHFLTHSSTCTSKDAVNHILHYLDLGLENNLCLGCDFDGIDVTPADLKSIDDLPNLHAAMEQAGIDKNTIDKIFYQNYINFAEKEF